MAIIIAREINKLTKWANNGILLGEVICYAMRYVR